MIRYLLVLIIFCTFLGSVSAQNIDSLRQALENADKRYEQIATSHAIADYFFRLNLDSMAKYAEGAIELALELEDDSLIAKSYLMAGNAALTKGNMDIALEYYTTGAEYVSEETYPILLEGLSNNIGIILYRKEEYERALNYFLQAQELFTLFPDKANYDYANALSALYANLGALYETLGEEEEALDYYHQALSLGLKYDILNRVATVYSNIGNLHLHESRYQLAEANFNQSLLIYDSLKNKQGQATMLGHLGDLYAARGEVDLAIETLENSIEVGKEAGMGFVHLYSSKGLHGLYAEKGDFDEAYRVLLEHKELNDSIFNVNKMAEMSRIEAEHSFEEERQIFESEKRFQQLMNIALSGGFIATLMLFILAMSSYRSKTKLQKAKSENLEMTNALLKEQLQFKSKELTTNVMYLLKKNEFINTVSERLLSMKADFKKENQRIINKIILDLQKATEEDVWHEFETHFNMVHSDFYENLLKENPNLSLNERKLCAFIRLNLTSKEICAITYQTPNTLQVARTRLRKKLNLESNDQLFNYLQQF